MHYANNTATFSDQSPHQQVCFWNLILNYHSRNRSVTGKTKGLVLKSMPHKSCHILYAFIQLTVGSQFKNTTLGSLLTLATTNPLQYQMTKVPKFAIAP